MVHSVKASVLLLLLLGVIFAIPIVAVGYSVHGYDLALLAAACVVLLVFLGPLSFLFAIELASGSELVVLCVAGVLLVFAWIMGVWKRGTTRDGYSRVPYMPVTCWALLGAYFCVSLYFEHAL